jgi:hypothetical protein
MRGDRRRFGLQGGSRWKKRDPREMETNVEEVAVSLFPVEICITLGRMTGSPFSPVHPVPAK